MDRIRVAAHTYTWEMQGPEWCERLQETFDGVAQAGYDGIEIATAMLGPYYGRPHDLRAELRRRELQLAAVAYGSPSGFTDPAHWNEDLAGARKAIELLRHFPEPRLGLAGANSPSREDAGAKLDQAIRFYNGVGQMAAAAGISVTVHPHSRHGSLLESAEEYLYLVERLDPALVNLGPDTGHIVRGGQDLLGCLRAHLRRVTHLHLKDVTEMGEWAALGAGVCDYPGVIGLLTEAGYRGWLVVEDESDAVCSDTPTVVRQNRAYLRSLGL